MAIIPRVVMLPREEPLPVLVWVAIACWGAGAGGGDDVADVAGAATAGESRGGCKRSTTVNSRTRRGHRSTTAQATAVDEKWRR